MAMSIGNRSGASSDINVTPLIDVLLVLLIIFMVISPLDSKGVRTVVPRVPQDRPQSKDPTTVVLQVLADDASGRPRLKLNQEDTTWDTLQAKLDDIYKKRADRVLFVQGDDGIEFQYVAQVIDIAHSAGVDKVGLLTARIEQGG